GEAATFGGPGTPARQRDGDLVGSGTTAGAAGGGGVSLFASTRRVMSTSSPSISPPWSAVRFQTIPKSFRLIGKVTSKPAFSCLPRFRKPVCLTGTFSVFVSP